MYTVEPHIKAYIKEARKEFGDEIRKDLRAYREQSKKEIKGYHDDSKRHMSALAEEFRENMKAFKEIMPTLLTEEKVREIVHEELQPVRSDLRLCITEIGQINKKSDHHESRISKLEWNAI